MPTLIQNLCIYRVKAGAEKEFEKILRQHAPTLEKSGLVTGKIQTWKATDIREGGAVYVETIPWKDAEAPEQAHQLPEIMKIWEPMTPLLDKLELLNLGPLPS